jgi:hypothetical protein
MSIPSPTVPPVSPPTFKNLFVERVCASTWFVRFHTRQIATINSPGNLPGHCYHVIDTMGPMESRSLGHAKTWDEAMALCLQSSAFRDLCCSMVAAQAEKGGAL